MKRQDNSNNIPMIKKGDKVITSNKGINEVFEEFYRNLYTSECKPSEEETDAFFSGLEIPTISDEQKERLDAPLTEDEIRATIRAMKPGKSPGLDGFPVEYYKKIWILLPRSCIRFIMRH